MACQNVGEHHAKNYICISFLNSSAYILLHFEQRKTLFTIFYCQL